MSVGLWGQGDTGISVRRPVSALATLLRHSRARGTVSWEESGVAHFLTPTVTWSPRAPWQELSGAVRATRVNICAAEARHGPIDVLHAHASYPAGFVASILAAELGVPMVLTEHMAPFPLPRLRSGGKPIRQVDQALRAAVVTIAVSRRLAAEMSSQGYPGAIVIPNLVGDQDFAHKPTSRRAGSFRFVTVAAIEPRKGIDVLLRAFACLDDDAELVIVGEGPVRRDLQGLARALAIDHRVSWRGAVDHSEVPAVIGGCDALVLASRHESFGVVLIEALACGLPVISTRCGGPEEIVTSSNGVLVDVDDIDGLAAAMTRTMRDDDNYDGEAIRKDCLARFGEQAVVRQLREVYDSLLR